MTTLIPPDERESVLAQWRGADAAVWMFHISLSRMAIHLYRKGQHESLYIVAVGCERICGPIRWEPADIAIVTEQPDKYGAVRRRLVDSRAGFELLCSDVTICRRARGIPSNPFTGFFFDDNDA
jgi:hypothetical protein